MKPAKFKYQIILFRKKRVKPLKAGYLFCECSFDKTPSGNFYKYIFQSCFLAMDSDHIFIRKKFLNAARRICRLQGNLAVFKFAAWHNYCCFKRTLAVFLFKIKRCVHSYNSALVHKSNPVGKLIGFHHILGGKKHGSSPLAFLHNYIMDSPG